MRTKETSSRNFRNFNNDKFTKDFKSKLETSSYSAHLQEDANLLLSLIQETALELLDEQAPMVSHTIKRNPAPWFTDLLRSKCKQRDELYRQAKRSGDAVLEFRFKSLRKQIKSEVKLAREKYLSEKLNATVDSGKKWSLLNKIGAVGERRPGSPLESFTANELNKFYASVATAHPPCTPEELDENLSIPLDLEKPIFNLTPITHIQVLQKLPLNYYQSVKGVALMVYN